MRIQKNLNEISEILSKQSGRNIVLVQTAPDRIRIRYLTSIDLTLSGHSSGSLMFRYTLGRGTNLLAKSAGGLSGGIQTKKLSLDLKEQTVQVNLTAFGEFKNILNTHRITAARIEDNVLAVDLAEKSQAV